MNDKGPCYGCPERHLHCHRDCESYIAYASALRAKKDLVRGIKEKNYIYTEYANERYVKHRIDRICTQKMCRRTLKGDKE